MPLSLPAQDRAGGPSPAPAAAAQAMDPGVLVSFGDKRITALDFDAAMQKVPEEHRYEYRRQMKRITNVLNGILINRSLAAEARALGLDKDPVAQRQIELAIEEALAIARVAALRKAVAVPDMEQPAREHYKLYQEKYRIEAQVNAAHVLISTKDRSDQEALDRAKLVRSKLLGGAKLSELVTEYSDDPSAGRNKGELGFFGKGRMVKEFEAAALALKTPGQVSETVKSQFGYHVIQLIERREEQQRPFEEVKDSIIKGLVSDYIDREVAGYVSKIEAAKDIQLNTKAIDGLQTFLLEEKHKH